MYSWLNFWASCLAKDPGERPENGKRLLEFLQEIYVGVAGEPFAFESRPTAVDKLIKHLFGFEEKDPLVFLPA